MGRFMITKDKNIVRTTGSKMPIGSVLWLSPIIDIPSNFLLSMFIHTEQEKHHSDLS